MHPCANSVIYIMLNFFFNDPATTEIYTLSLHDALPIFLAPAISPRSGMIVRKVIPGGSVWAVVFADSAPLTLTEVRSEEHTSELQSRRDLVCRLLLEKKKKTKIIRILILINPNRISIS